MAQQIEFNKKMYTVYHVKTKIDKITPINSRNLGGLVMRNKPINMTFWFDADKMSKEDTTYFSNLKVNDVVCFSYIILHKEKYIHAGIIELIYTKPTFEEPLNSTVFDIFNKQQNQLVRLSQSKVSEDIFEV